MAGGFLRPPQGWAAVKGLFGHVPSLHWPQEQRRLGTMVLEEPQMDGCCSEGTGTAAGAVPEEQFEVPCGALLTLGCTVGKGPSGTGPASAPAPVPPLPAGGSRQGKTGVPQKGHLS